jgi:hypothetical protein
LQPQRCNPGLAEYKKNGHSFYMGKPVAVNPINPARRLRFAATAAPAIGVAPAVRS